MDELTQEDKHIRVCFMMHSASRRKLNSTTSLREKSSLAPPPPLKEAEDVKQFPKAVSPSITLEERPTDTRSADLKVWN